jgi:hypothetical protein
VTLRTLACLAVVLGVGGRAWADGERTPMLGASLLTARDGKSAELVGVALEATWWWGRIGVAAEGAQRADVADVSVHTGVLGASLRVLVADQLMPSLLEPRDVDLGLELHGMVERAWSSRVDTGDDPAVRYGLGLAARMRGGGDDDSALLAESRLFVRVLWSGSPENQVVARTNAPVSDREVLVIVGLGAAWGLGERQYTDKLKRHPTETVDWGQITIER